MQIHVPYLFALSTITFSPYSNNIGIVTALDLVPLKSCSIFKIVLNIVTHRGSPGWRYRLREWLYLSIQLASAPTDRGSLWFIMGVGPLEFDITLMNRLT